VPTVPETPLRIGLLQCGHIHPDLVTEHGDYPEVFADLLGPFGIELTAFDVDHGGLPADLPEGLDAFDGWLVSGSADSAYDDRPWIPPLEDALRAMIAREVPLVAVCFGHQLLAQAMGGRVAKSPDGWGAGVHAYELLRTGEPWMVPPSDGPLRIIASHQDQVVELPDGAVLLARTDHCPVAAYTLGPAALAIQPHPEFTSAVSGGLVGLRRERIGAGASDAALASLDQLLDRELVAGWMAAFWRGAVGRRS
jgi:GMP synthase-like glutamine amidotransferase